MFSASKTSRRPCEDGALNAEKAQAADISAVASESIPPFAGGTLRQRFYSEWCSWKCLRSRCLYPSNPSFKYVGGRGLTFCERWKSFENFLADMGPKPSPKHSIDRIDNSKGYSPENCRWATDREQQINTCKAKFLTLNGKTQCLSDWARETGISHRTIGSRLELGWTVEDALTIPPLMGNNQLLVRFRKVVSR